jgi:tetratricopeptide (TPR) repeat protein
MMTRKVQNIFRIIITLCVISFWVLYILRECPKIQRKHQLDRLNVMVIPLSFAHLGKGLKREDPWNKGELKKYIHFYKQVVEYFPDRADAHGMLGFCYFHVGMSREALASFKKANELAPENFWFLYNLGVTYFSLNQQNASLEAMKRAVLSSPEKTIEFIKKSKGIYAIVLSDVPSMWLETPARLRAGYRDAYLLMILTYFKNKDYSSSFQYAVHALQTQWPGQELFLYYAGISLYQMKDYKGAINYFQKCVSVDSQFGQARYFWAMSLEALGDSGKKTEEMKTLSKNSLKNLEFNHIQLQIF